MPLSRPQCIPAVIDYIWSNNPQSLLDVGVGFGGMGVLFRQTMDVRWGRVRSETWETTLDGIEIDEDYENKCWDVYSNVFIGDVRELITKLDKKYDLIFFGDILEHLEKNDALELVKIAKNISKTILITTPQNFSGNEAEAERFDNEYETHKCLLEDSDFPDAVIEKYGGQKLIILQN